MNLQIFSFSYNFVISSLIIGLLHLSIFFFVTEFWNERNEKKFYTPFWKPLRKHIYLNIDIMIEIINTISSSISWWSAKKRFKNRMLKNYQKLEFNLGHLGTGGKLYFHEYLQKKNSKNSNPLRFKHFLCFPPPL